MNCSTLHHVKVDTKWILTARAVLSEGRVMTGRPSGPLSDLRRDKISSLESERPKEFELMLRILIRIYPPGLAGASLYLTIRRV